MQTSVADQFPRPAAEKWDSENCERVSRLSDLCELCGLMVLWSSQPQLRHARSVSLESLLTLANHAGASIWVRPPFVLPGLKRVLRNSVTWSKMPATSP